MKRCDHIWCNLEIDSSVDIGNTLDPQHTRQMKQLMTNQMIESFLSSVRPKKVGNNIPVWLKLPLSKLNIRTPLTKHLLALFRSQTPLHQGDALFNPKSKICEANVKGRFKWILLSILSVIPNKYVPLYFVPLSFRMIVFNLHTGRQSYFMHQFLFQRLLNRWTLWTLLRVSY